MLNEVLDIILSVLMAVTVTLVSVFVIAMLASIDEFVWIIIGIVSTVALFDWLLSCGSEPTINIEVEYEEEN